MTERVPLLLHSMSDMRELWLPLLVAADVHKVVEVGAESGAGTRRLARHLGEHGGGRLVTVDPAAPEIPLDELPDDVELRVVRAYSPEALEDLEPADCWVLDGDHNYHTITAELAVIERTAGGSFPLVLLNDVAWPCARRDLYYTPARIPTKARQEYSWDGGLRPGQPGVDSSGGFRGSHEFAYAVHEGGARNGVLTGVEDFMATRPHLELFVVEVIFGLGVLFPRDASYAHRVRELMAPFAGSPFLSRMESNRVQLYLRVLDLQDLVATQSAEVAGLHARLTALQAAERTARTRRASADADAIE